MWVNLLSGCQGYSKYWLCAKSKCWYCHARVVYMFGLGNTPCIKVSECDQEIPQSHTAEQSMAP